MISSTADRVTSQLRNLCVFVRDGDWIESKDQGGTDYRLIQISNIGVGEFVETGNVRCISADTFRRLHCTEVLPGDVLVARMPEPTGRAWFIADLPRPSITAVDVAIIRPRPSLLDGRFLSFVLNTPRYLAIADGLSVGTTRRRFRRRDIEALAIPVPPMEEQRRIAATLGRLDDKIDVNRRISETLEEITRALFTSWFVDFDPVRGAATVPEDIRRLFPDRLVDSPIGPVPEGWEVAPLGEHIGVTRGLSYTGAGLADEGMPLHNLNSIREGGGYKEDGIKHYVGEFRERDRVRPGDVIVANTDLTQNARVIGSPAIVPRSFGDDGLYSHHLYHVRPVDGSPLTRHWLYILLVERRIHRQVVGYSNGTTVNMLPKDGLTRPLIAVPPNDLVERFASVVAPMFDQQEALSAESKTLAALRDTLLPKLISGELRLVESPPEFPKPAGETGEREEHDLQPSEALDA